MGIHNDIDVTTLLDRPLWQLTGREFCALTQFATANLVSKTDTPRRNCKGIEALASELGCSESYIYEVMKLTRCDPTNRNDYGVLSAAVVSRIGKAIVFNVDTARRAISEFKEKRNI